MNTDAQPVQNPVPQFNAAVPMLPPPPISIGMLPPINQSVEKQSPQDWMDLFVNVAESFIELYRMAGQEIVGQRQALAAIPSLLNRNESERRLATRIIQECTTIRQAQELVIKTIGNLENECQATEAFYNMKRGSRSPEDFYAILLEKDKKHVTLNEPL